MSRVLLVDDEPQLVHALRRALEQDDHEVVAAADGETGIEYAATAQPDLVVLDLKLPDLDGVEVVRRLRPWFEPPILILSAVTDETRKVQALDAGADDFLNKPFGVRELTARMRALLRRGAGGAEQKVLQFPDLEIDLPARNARTPQGDLRLTPTEWRILEAMVTQPGKLLTHRWLLHQVWDDSHGDEARQSLRSHMRSLRAKLGDDASAPRYVRTESGAGYRWLPMPDSDDDPAPAAETPTGDGAPRSFDDVMHDLNNVLTAMRFAAYLSRPRVQSPSEDASARLAELGTRWESLVLRASELAAELEHAR